MNTITPFELAQLVLLMKGQGGPDSWKPVKEEDIDNAVQLLLKCGKAIAEYREGVQR